MQLHNLTTKHYTLLLVLAMLLWGGGWSALKILTADLDAHIIIFWRFFFMSLAFLPILYFLKEPLVLRKKSLPFVGASSVLNIAFMVFSFFGIKYGYAGGGSVIITTLTPLVSFILGVLFFGKRLSLKELFGLFLGVVGGAVMMQVNDLTLFMQPQNLYFLLCALSWAGVTLLAQYSQAHIHPVHYSFYIAVVATVVTFFYGYGDGLMLVFEQDSRFWVALIYLAVLGQSVATTIFFMASGVLGSEKTSAFMFLVPFFALLSAYVVLNEDIMLHIVVGGLLSSVAIFFINRKNDDKTS